MNYSGTILYCILLVLLVIGAFMELSNPTFVNPEFKYIFIKITLGILAIFLSFYLLIFFLSFRNREGFEDKDVFQNTKAILEDNKLEQICKVYDDVYKNIFKVEKGIPPESFTDEQAREKTLNIIKKEMIQGPISCPKVQKLKEAVNAKDIDALFTVTQELPNSFLVEAFETAKGCRALLKKNVDEIQVTLAGAKDGTIPNENLDKMEVSVTGNEGFIDPSVGVCSPEITEERRKFLREKKLSEKAQSCLLPEEVPLDKKDSYIQTKLDKINATFKEYLKTETSKETIQAILDDCAYYKKELDKIKKQGESGNLANAA